ncbi:MAG: sulfotransferase [Saprospirales bacterium]|nr:sulfotransferase [Saprospirales bacterium]
MTNFLFRLKRKFRTLLGYTAHLVRDLVYRNKRDHYSKFLIVCNGRTGSNMLISYLNSHPSIVCYREIFHHHAPNMGLEYESLLDKEKMRKLSLIDPSAFLRRYVFKGYPAKVKAVGFKLIYWQAMGSEYYEKLPRHLASIEGLKVIHLVRTNKLDLVVSKKVALKTNKWLALNRKETHSDMKITITPSEMEEGLNLNTELEERFEKMFDGCPSIKVSYEDIVGDPQKKLEKYWTFSAFPARN